MNKSKAEFKVHQRVVWSLIFIVFGVYLVVMAEVQEDQAHKGIAREVHPSLQVDTPWMRNGMTMLEKWCLQQKKKEKKKQPGTRPQNLRRKQSRKGPQHPKKKQPEQGP